jgi:hypothetical protein
MMNPSTRGVRDWLWVVSTIGRSSETAAVRHDLIARFIKYADAESTLGRKQINSRAQSVFCASTRQVDGIRGKMRSSAIAPST